MTSIARAIENYETLSTLTRELREAAARGEWDRLTEIQQQRTALVESMAALDSSTCLGELALRRKNELIEQVLADEAETRERVKTWMAQMESELQEGRQELRLFQAHGLLW